MWLRIGLSFLSLVATFCMNDLNPGNSFNSDPKKRKKKKKEETIVDFGR
jgi:hypothetical protein